MLTAVAAWSCPSAVNPGKGIFLSDGEDDIPLDLILKEEPFEVINGQIEPETNNQAIINQESTKNESELCAFENCGICKQNVVLGQGKWGASFILF